MLNEIKAALSEVLVAAGVPAKDAGGVELEIPTHPAHGDLTTNAALVFSKKTGMQPPQLAAKLAAAGRQLPFITAAEVAGPGFVNLRVADEVIFAALVQAVQEGDEFGRGDEGNGLKVQVEFVSANPTGPLNAVNARAAAYGDALARLLAFVGYDVQREYYVCDVGTQIALLGASVRERFLEYAEGKKPEIPEEGYHGDYVIPLARRVFEEKGEVTPQDDDERIGRAAANIITAEHQDTLRAFGVDNVIWFHESWLYEQNKIEETLRRIKAAGLCYESDGALWFKTTAGGDDEDRVIIRSDGRPTYFMADVAYHLNKFDRGFEKVIDVLGPDHHGHTKKMLAALALLGLPASWLEIIISQQVNMVEGGTRVKMSKRAGALVPMDELVADPGVDASRFFFLTRSPSAHLDFDLTLARQQSLDNPVYYVQYCHARVASIKKEAGRDADAPPERAPLNALNQTAERQLAREIWQFPLVIKTAASKREPHKVTAFATRVAGLFHNYYQHHRILQAPTQEQKEARLVLARAVGQTIKNALSVLGVSAPVRM